MKNDRKYKDYCSKMTLSKIILNHLHISKMALSKIIARNIKTPTEDTQKTKTDQYLKCLCSGFGQYIRTRDATVSVYTLYFQLSKSNMHFGENIRTYALKFSNCKVLCSEIGHVLRNFQIL